MKTVIQSQRSIENATRVVLFGASGLGEIFLSEFTGSANVVGFVDNDLRKAGGKLGGVPIFAFDQLASLKPDFIIVTSQYYEQIINQLTGLQIPFCHCSDVIVKESGRWAKWHFYLMKGLYRSAKWLFGLIYREPRHFLHIMPKGGFAESFRTLIADHDKHAHHRFIYRAAGDLHETLSHNTQSIPEISYEKGHWYPSQFRSVLTFAKAVAQSNHVMVHGYFNVARFPFILDPGLNRKASWVAWGRDIHTVPSRGGFIEEKIKRSKGMFPYLITFMEYDYLHARQRYQSRARNFVGFYPNPLSAEHLTDAHVQNDTVKVMVGHSAVDEMHHIPVLRALANNNAQSSIIAPLSYGNDGYADKVAKEGASLFDNFTAMKAFMAPDEYAPWLSTINVAVMHTHTQIALSTMYALLYTGATLYINKKNSSLWAHFTERYGLVVLDSNDLLEGEKVQLLTDEQRYFNRKQAERFFDTNWIAAQWSHIFDEIEG